MACLLGVGGSQWGALSFGGCVALSCWAGWRPLCGEALLSQGIFRSEAKGSRLCLCDRAMLTLQGPCRGPTTLWRCRDQTLVPQLLGGQRALPLPEPLFHRLPASLFCLSPASPELSLSPSCPDGVIALCPPAG